jgi:hypothetical protein
MKTAKARYDYLSGYRSQFLTTAITCSRLTLPYLIKDEGEDSKASNEVFTTPWQSVGAKGVVTLSAKLMLALFPVQTSFFKFQLNDLALGQQLSNQELSEIDLSFAKMERQVMEEINASNDRVLITQALKHLVVCGNGLIFMAPKGLKFYPLNRYVVDRDGSQAVTEIVTREKVNRSEINDLLQKNGGKGRTPTSLPDPNRPGEDGGSADELEEVDVYTHVYKRDGRWFWHQEAEDIILPGTKGNSPDKSNPWLVLRFNAADGELYGRGRVEEFLGDLRSLEALMQALVEGSALAAQVKFLLDPSTGLSPKFVEDSPNGAILPGKKDSLVPVQVGKSMDFNTAKEVAATLERRISEAFLVMNVRQSERTTAEEVKMTQMELEMQLGGLFSVLTVELLLPYLNRKLSTMQRQQELPKIPDKLVKPTIVAGLNAIGRGQDREALRALGADMNQMYGPEIAQRLIDPSEYVKRLCASYGIDTINLLNTKQQLQQQKQQEIQQQKEMSLVNQTGQLAGTPLMDPSKNPQLANGESSPIQAAAGQSNPAGPTPPGQQAPAG